MTFYILAYAAGVLTIASPCILPILPLVMAGAGRPFRYGGMPLLIGLALTFAVVATLASFAGGWAVETHRVGRNFALAALTLFGLSMLTSGLATRLTAPLVLVGSWLADRAGSGSSGERTSMGFILLGIATAFVWAPCAGPVLGLILTGAALRGPSFATTMLMLAYALGAATSLAAGMLLSARLLTWIRRAMPWSDGLRRVLGAAIVICTAAIWTGLDTGVLTPLSLARTFALENRLVSSLRPLPEADPAPVGDAHGTAPSKPLASVLGAMQWLNTPPLTAADLRGKVVLVNFWTYSCINCLRALPYVRGWAQKYSDQGLVVIGIHTPEFAFEKDVGNINKAADRLGVKYPIAIDSDFRIWRAFDNNAWPALYFLDANGRMRHQTIGEGDYATSEMIIQQLLVEAGHKSSMEVSDIKGDGAQAASDGGNLQSPEIYLGYGQASGFASRGGILKDEPKLYHNTPLLPLDHWSLDGAWTIGREYAVLNKDGGSLSVRFHARDVHLVMGPATTGTPVRFQVTIDGLPPGENHGVDTDVDGWGTIVETRLYQLIRQSRDIKDRSFTIRFFEKNVCVYVFTFG